MATIPKTGISTSSTIEAAHVTNIIDALDGTTSRELKVPGSMQVTGSLDTRGTNTHGGANTFGGAVTVNNVFDLSGQASAFRRRVQVLNNSSATTVNLASYVPGTTFEIDLGSSTTNDITINLVDPGSLTYHVEYDIRFSRDAAGSGATFILTNSGNGSGGGSRFYGLNCNSNDSFVVNPSQAMTTTQTGLQFSHIKINNVLNAVAEVPFWQMRVWSNHSGLFSIA
jgi:hypothetical protein|tara:strand:- start:16605 stop:17282 length:678 start_codon:yes stop_codon:yes gene_type:complete